MAEKRRALGRGLGALIPSAPQAGGDRPVDVFFRDRTAPTANPAGVGPGDESRNFPDTAEPASDQVAEASSTGLGGFPSDHDGRVENEPDSEPVSGVPGADQPERDQAPAETVTPGDLAPVPGAEFAEIDVTAIRPNPKQPRRVFDEDDMAELVHSIREIGVLQPIVVRRVTDGAPGAGPEREGGDQVVPGQPRFELIMGERRWRATQLAGLEVVPAIIKDTHDDDLLRDALLENLHRSQLNALEEAAAYQQLLDDFGCSHDELATRIGRSRPQISNTLRLLKLPPLVQRRLAAGVLSAGHARALLGLSDGGAIERMAQRIVAEGLSVRTVEELVSLGDDETPARARRPRAGSHHPQLDDFTANLADRLETRVTIALGQRKGKITVEFASMEDLRRILGIMGLDESQS